jgi:N-methylhydantoinase A/acetone carboxylase, beta subunit
MSSNVVLGVSVGESFLEMTLAADGTSFSGQKILAQKRAYLPRESLKSSLSQFLEANKETPPTKAFVGMRFLEKLLSYRLGGSVAQIVTQGFENWMQIRTQSATSSQPLTESELLFAVNERVSYKGEVVTEIQESELVEIAAKLKELGCKRVCIHFLHAHANATHETTAAAYFAAQGFEVYVPQKTDNTDEVSRWRKNLLNASVSSTFTELKAEITECVSAYFPAEQIFFLNGQGKQLQNEAPERLQSIFAANTALRMSYADETDVVYLGLERFTLMSYGAWTATWQSPWGQVEAPQAQTRDLKIQPTLQLDLNTFRHISFTNKSEGWEPGPMFMGRGQKPCLLDLWSENSKLGQVAGLNDRVVAAGVQKFKNSLLTLLKNSSSKGQEVDSIIKDLQSLSVQSLVAEVTMLRRSKKLWVVGPLAPLLANGFKKDPSVTIVGDEYLEAKALAYIGAKA